MDDSMKLSVPDSVMLAEATGEMVLLNTATGSFFGVDQVGCRFWECLVSVGSFKGALEMLVNEYEVDIQTLREDLEQFVRILTEVGLINLE